jgi:hypothetical protein
MARIIFSGFLLMLPAILWGCCSKPAPPLPTYDWVDVPTALRTMAQRSKSIQTIQAPNCTIDLFRPNGESVRLDAVLVSRPPNHLRLRASKFGRVAIDLTLTPQGLWILESQNPQSDSATPAKADLKRLTARQLATAWSIFTSHQFDHPNLKVTDKGGTSFQLTRKLNDQLRFIATVDRATLTVLRYELFGVDNRALSTIWLGRYREFPIGVWPTFIVAQSDTGKVEITLYQLEFNEVLAPAVFKPPRRAVKQPARADVP